MKSDKQRELDYLLNRGIWVKERNGILSFTFKNATLGANQTLTYDASKEKKDLVETVKLLKREIAEKLIYDKLTIN